MAVLDVEGLSVRFATDDGAVDSLHHDAPAPLAPRDRAAVRLPDGAGVRFATDDGVVQAVDGLSFDLGEREVLGIVGESGCGKSVSLMSLLRLLPPSAKVDGTATFDGI